MACGQLRSLSFRIRENVERQQRPSASFQSIPRLGLTGGGGRKLLSWIIHRIAERDFQPGPGLVRLPASSFLATALDRNKKTLSSIPTEWAYFPLGEHIQDYTDLSKVETTGSELLKEEARAIDAIVKAHTHGSMEALRIYMHLHCHHKRCQQYHLAYSRSLEGHLGSNSRCQEDRLVGSVGRCRWRRGGLPTSLSMESRRANQMGYGDICRYHGQ